MTATMVWHIQIGPVVGVSVCVWGGGGGVILSVRSSWGGLGDLPS